MSTYVHFTLAADMGGRALHVSCTLWMILGYLLAAYIGMPFWMTFYNNQLKNKLQSNYKKFMSHAIRRSSGKECDSSSPCQNVTITRRVHDIFGGYHPF